MPTAAVGGGRYITHDDELVGAPQILSRTRETQGPGKLDLSGGQRDRQHRHPLPIKHVYVYPLHKHFRQELRATPGP